MSERKPGTKPGSRWRRVKDAQEPEIWHAVKRVEATGIAMQESEKRMAKMMTALESQVRELKTQIKKANAVIITLAKQQDATDFAELERSHHNYGKR